MWIKRYLSFQQIVDIQLQTNERTNERKKTKKRNRDRNKIAYLVHINSLLHSTTTFTRCRTSP